MANAFDVLGVSRDADQEQVRKAYLQRVKTCHPDLFETQDEQDAAQRELVALNLAYEEAMQAAAGRKPAFHTIPLSQVKSVTERLISQKQYESALCQLSRADSKDAEWYNLQGLVLQGMKQYDTAHQSFREAVRRCPDNLDYRRNALDAAVAVKKENRLLGRLAKGMRNLLGGLRRK